MLWSRMNWSPVRRHQQQRYGHRWEGDNATDDDEADAAAEAELARQFAATQQQRYATEQPPAPTRSRRQIMNSRR